MNDTTLGTPVAAEFDLDEVVTRAVAEMRPVERGCTYPGFSIVDPAWTPISGGDAELVGVTLKLRRRTEQGKQGVIVVHLPSDEVARRVAQGIVNRVGLDFEAITYHRDTRSSQIILFPDAGSNT